MKKVLILCTGNSCRSQMAEGYLKKFGLGMAQIFSAGVETHGVNPRAIAVMLEEGIDLSSHTSNHMNEYLGISFDYVITVCDHARDRCPVFPSAALQIHRNFPDPGKAVGSEEFILSEFRAVRNHIREFCRQFAKDHLNMATSHL